MSLTELFINFLKDSEENESSETEIFAEHTSLSASELIPSFPTEDQISKLIDKVVTDGTVELEMDALSLAKLRESVRVEVLEAINLPSFSDTLQPRTYAMKMVRTFKVKLGADRRPETPYLYENNSPNGPNPGSEFRKDMILKILAEKLVFSISLIPAIPTVHSTIYYKKGYTEGPSTGMKSSTSTRPETPDISVDILKGFFKPFPSFSSSEGSPQYDPDDLPSNVLQFSIFQESEILSVLHGEEIRNSVQRILSVFLNDISSRGLGLILLQPPSTVVEMYIRKER